MKNKLLWAALFAGSALALISTRVDSGSAEAAGKRKPNGEQIFKQHCASCHASGGNNVKPEHPVAGSKQLSTLAVFKSYLSNPPGHMPYYQDVVTNKATLEALYKYCKNLKKEPVKQASIKANSNLY